MTAPRTPPLNIETNTVASLERFLEVLPRFATERSRLLEALHQAELAALAMAVLLKAEMVADAVERNLPVVQANLFLMDIVQRCGADISVVNKYFVK